jgi:hypothetical protein
MSLQPKTETYLGNINVKKDGVQQDWTRDQVLEYKKCMDDPVYFTEKYIKVIQLDRGLVDFKLYDYQKKMFNQFNDNRFNVVLACRQSGKSISACAYLLWYALFNPEKTIAILANKGATAREMLGRITLMLENVPFFLQPGCKTLNKGSMEFSNNSRIVASSTSTSSIRGYSVNLLYLDEFAFVEKAAEFYTSTYPVVSSGSDTKVIITSTANGLGNMFHRLWEGAVQKVNEFVPFRVDWHDVPGRDEKWKEQTIANTSQLQFDQEFGNTFFGTSHTLINPEVLIKFRAQRPLEIRESGLLSIYEKNIDEHQYVMTVDVSKGRGQDYSTFNVIDISTKPWKQVAVYRNNNISPMLFPDIIYKYANVYNKAYVVIESNDQGTIVCNGLYYDFEYDNMYVESAVKAGQLGIEMNRRVKRLGCTAMKDILEANNLEIVDQQTISELSTFVLHGQSYKAVDGAHDDLAMGLVLFSYFVSSQYFEEMANINLKQLLFENESQTIEEDLVPFGFVDDGLQEEIAPDYERDNWSIWDTNL